MQVLVLGVVLCTGLHLAHEVVSVGVRATRYAASWVWEAAQFYALQRATPHIIQSLVSIPFTPPVLVISVGTGLGIYWVVTRYRWGFVFMALRGIVYLKTFDMMGSQSVPFLAVSDYMQDYVQARLSRCLESSIEPSPLPHAI